MNTIDVELFVSIKQLPVKSDSKLTAKKLYSDTFSVLKMNKHHCMPLLLCWSGCLASALCGVRDPGPP